MTALVDATNLAIPGRLQPSEVSSSGGELVGLVGPNGSGKTSLLRALTQVEGARGAVRIDGSDLRELNEAQRRRKLGFLPAGREIVWPISATGVIALGLDKRDASRVEALLDVFELQSFADRPTSSLSTGERSRVLLARVLASNPRLILLDEPLSHLDPLWTLRTLDILGNYARAGATVILSVHDLGLLRRFDRLILMDKGTVRQTGMPSQVTREANELFGVEPDPELGWRISSPADRRSSP